MIPSATVPVYLSSPHQVYNPTNPMLKPKYTYILWVFFFTASLLQLEDQQQCTYHHLAGGKSPKSPKSPKSLNNSPASVTKALKQHYNPKTLIIYQNAQVIYFTLICMKAACANDPSLWIYLTVSVVDRENRGVRGNEWGGGWKITSQQQN